MQLMETFLDLIKTKPLVKKSDKKSKDYLSTLKESKVLYQILNILFSLHRKALEIAFLTKNLKGSL